MAWYVALGPWVHHNCSNDDPRLTLTYFMARSNLVSYAFIWGKLLESHLIWRTLQQMTRVTKGLCLHKNSDPKGLSAPAPGLYTCIKTWNIMYKIRLQRYLFETCNNFWPQRVVCPALGLYTCGKTLRNVYKIRIQRDLFETCNKWSKW